MRQLLIFVNIISLLFLNSCRQIETKKNLSSMKKEYKKPIYNLKIQAASPYEVSINDILIDYHYDSGAVDYDIDLNQWILNSGVVKLEAKIFPTIKNPSTNVVDKLISEYFKISLFVSDKEGKSGAEQLLQEFKFSLQEIEMPVLIESWEVELNVPYQSIGWKESENLLNDDKEMLISEIREVYSKITKSINKGNITQYNTFFRKADEEYFQSMYCDEREVDETFEDISRIISMAKNKTVFSEDYDVQFYANGKIVTLEKKDRKSPIYADLEDSIQYFGVFLHRPSADASLEVIR